MIKCALRCPQNGSQLTAFTSIYRRNQNCTIQLIKKATKNINLPFREPTPMLRMTDVIL